MKTQVDLNKIVEIFKLSNMSYSSFKSKWDFVWTKFKLHFFPFFRSQEEEEEEKKTNQKTAISFIRRIIRLSLCQKCSSSCVIAAAAVVVVAVAVVLLLLPSSNGKVISLDMLQTPLLQLNTAQHPFRPLASLSSVKEGEGEPTIWRNTK